MTNDGNTTAKYSKQGLLDWIPFISTNGVPGLSLRAAKTDVNTSCLFRVSIIRSDSACFTEFLATRL